MGGVESTISEVSRVEIAQSVVIKVLHSEECGNAPHALKMAESAVEDLDRDAEIQMVVVSDEAAAVEAGFRGSPTVTVNGVDVELGTALEVGMGG